MALVQTDLKNILHTRLESSILKMEDKLLYALDDKNYGIYFVQQQIDQYIIDQIPLLKEKKYDISLYKKNLWLKISNEWSKTLSHQIINILSSEMSLILSDVISEEITKYIKTATIITPAGTPVAVSFNNLSNSGSATTTSTPPSNTTTTSSTTTTSTTTTSTTPSTLGTNTYYGKTTSDTSAAIIT